MLDGNLIKIEFGKTDYLTYRIGSGKTVEIYDIVVNSERRQGKGRWLVNRLIDSLPKDIRLVFAITRADNFIAQQFYESLRFRVVAPLRDFYGYKTKDGRDTVDAIMYGKNLDDEA